MSQNVPTHNLVVRQHVPPAAPPPVDCHQVVEALEAMRAWPKQATERSWGVRAKLEELPRPRNIVIIDGDEKDESALRAVLLGRPGRLTFLPLPCADMTLFWVDSVPATLLGGLAPLIEIVEPRSRPMSDLNDGLEESLWDLLEVATKQSTCGRSVGAGRFTSGNLNEWWLDAAEMAQDFHTAERATHRLLDRLLSRMRLERDLDDDPMLVVPIVDCWYGADRLSPERLLAEAGVLRHPNVTLAIFTRRPEEYERRLGVPHIRHGDVPGGG